MEAQHRPLRCALWRRRGALRGDVCGNAPLQHQLGQAPGVNKRASGRKRVPQTEPAGSEGGAGARPHGAGGVGHDRGLRRAGRR